MRLLGFPIDLWRITGADFIARTTYQMGKTPLLPIYAAALGASAEVPVASLDAARPEAGGMRLLRGGVWVTTALSCKGMPPRFERLSTNNDSELNG